MLLQRHILLPWLASAVLMFGLSYIWHGVVLKDLIELKIPLSLYLVLAGLVYLLIGLALPWIVHKLLEKEWLSLKDGFPFRCLMVGSVMGFTVYLLVFVLGLSFADHGMVHVLADAIWQMTEQGLGGLAVSAGIIFDLHKKFLEEEG